MKFRIVAVLGVLASLVAAQGVLTYPDVFYYKFNEGSGQQVVNHAIPGGALYQPTLRTRIRFSGTARRPRSADPHGSPPD